MISFGFFFLSFSFGVEKTNTFVRSRGSLENHTRFQTILVKVYTRFQTKQLKNHTLWGGTYLYSWCRGVPLPPGSQISIQMSMSIFTRRKFLFPAYAYALLVLLGENHACSFLYPAQKTQGNIRFRAQTKHSVKLVDHYNPCLLFSIGKNKTKQT